MPAKKKRPFPDMARLGPSKGTRPERLVQQFLRRVCSQWVTFNDEDIPGRPDAYLHFPEARRLKKSADVRIAVFVDGRFWHDPAYAKLKHRRHHAVDWTRKAQRNQRRDWRVNRQLIESGVHVIRVWDTSLTGFRTEATLAVLLNEISAIVAGLIENPEKPSKAIRISEWRKR